MQTDNYLPLLEGKRIAVTANHTSQIGQTHLVDSLLQLGIEVVKIFGPEHGFRGDAADGVLLDNEIDSQTGLPLVSLYGAKKKPAAEDLDGVDLMVFDIQDVGVRCYTYLSTLHYVMEACAENDIPVLVLDRPNPNGFYVGGPVLDTAFSSFVGLHPVPLVYGMTIGEYAQMINGEGWLKDGIRCELTVIPCANYTHDSLYILPEAPSPNLPNQTAVYLYPHLVLFEGTVVSCGRGTDFPFQTFGHPELSETDFSFTPRKIPGAAPWPKHEGIVCYGPDLRGFQPLDHLDLQWLVDTYATFADKESFFRDYFYNLSGTDRLRQWIEEGKSAAEIEQALAEELEAFEEVRERYLLYNQVTS